MASRECVGGVEAGGGGPLQRRTLDDGAGPDQSVQSRPDQTRPDQTRQDQTSAGVAEQEGQEGACNPPFF